MRLPSINALLLMAALPDMDTYIADVWIPQREGIFLDHLRGEGLLADTR